MRIGARRTAPAALRALLLAAGVTRTAAAPADPGAPPVANEQRSAPDTAGSAGPVAAPRDPGARAAAASASASIEALGSDDRDRVERAVAAITGAPRDLSDADALFAAARACEDKLADPGRALAIYDRIAGEHPSARVAAAAIRRAMALRPLVGPHGETAALARELARLIASADREPAGAVIRRGDPLADAAWPGAPRAALWLADYLRRTGHLAEASSRYATVIARWPASPEARDARRGAVGAALDARDWELAAALAAQLPAADPADRSVRDDLLAAAARGRRRARAYTAAWLAAAAAFAALLGSLLDAFRRSPPPRWRAALRPPFEVVYLAPIAAVLIGVAFTAHRLIAPAVATIATGGLVLGWLSGAALERVRLAGRPTRLRATGHILACLVGVAALAYIALTRDSLIDALIETVRFGPDT